MAGLIAAGASAATVAGAGWAGATCGGAGSDGAASDGADGAGAAACASDPASGNRPVAEGAAIPPAGAPAAAVNSTQPRASARITRSVLDRNGASSRLAKPRVSDPPSKQWARVQNRLDLARALTSDTIMRTIPTSRRNQAPASRRNQALRRACNASSSCRSAGGNLAPNLG